VRPIFHGAILISVASIFLGGWLNSTLAQPRRPPSTSELRDARVKLQRANDLYQAGKYTETETLLDEVQASASRWAVPSNPAARQQFEAIRQTVYTARVALQRQRAGGMANATANNLPDSKPRRRRSRQAMESPPQAAPVADARPGVSFTSEIAPLLAQQCTGCHQPDERGGGLSMQSFASLQTGGRSGPLWEAGKGGDSLLVRKLLGTADGQRMPLDGEPLSPETIGRIEAWIDAGASYDGGDAAESLTDLLADRRLKTVSLDELNRERAELADRNWALAFPNQAATTQDSPHFLVVGESSHEELKAYASELESTLERIQRLIATTEKQSEPEVARATVYVLSQYYELSEFARMIEGRALPRPANEAFWSSAGVDTYLVLRWPSDRDGAASPLTRGVAGVWLSARGGSPDWFVDGFADAVALKFTPALPRAKRLARDLTQLSKVPAKSSDFLSGRTPTDVRDAAACSLVQYLMRDRARFSLLINRVDRDRPFAEALQSVYGLDQAALLDQWWAQVQRL
jgi:hypothetical protein